MDTVFIVTEADEYVATGHLMECIVCAEELVRAGYQVLLWINDNAAHGLKKRIPCGYREYRRSIEADYDSFLQEIILRRVKTIVFNLREIREDFLDRVKRSITDDTKVICIDEFGHRNLPADIIINPMIDSYYWNYGKSRARLYCGAEYLILPGKLEELHRKEKKINEKIEHIVISMGGADPENHTPELMQMIPKLSADVVISVVIGAENKHEKEIEDVAIGRDTYIFRNIPNLPEMIFKADLLICAGGNTLHEAACVGTPAIMIPSRPHEKRTAECFVGRGFGIVIEKESDLKKKMSAAFHKINAEKVRNDMSKCGKRISDGLGIKRTINIIRRCPLSL